MLSSKHPLEKLPLGGEPKRQERRMQRPALVWRILSSLVLAAICLRLFFFIHPTSPLAAWIDGSLQVLGAVEPLSHQSCPQQPPRPPPSDRPSILVPPTADLAAWLSGAVKIDTSIGDEWPSPQQDPQRWQDKFGPFRDYLRATFPRTHQYGKVQQELVNEHALLYTWKGADPSLKPILLTAHQDVVPVDPNTVGQWKFPPFEGVVDNGTLWGRGAADTKSTLIAIMASLEALHEPSLNFEPRRTILVGFGFDEEASGHYGGASLARHLHDVYGPDSIEMLVDEGNPNVPKGEWFGEAVALVGVAEKGNTAVTITVESPGGHSSAPPPFTSIGYLAAILAELDQRPIHAEAGKLTQAHLQMLLCLKDAPLYRGTPLAKALRDVEWAMRASVGVERHLPWPVDVARRLALAILRPGDDHRRRQRLLNAEKHLLKVLPHDEYIQFTTTQTIDLVSGGTKINALPESAQASIDHRIATWDNSAGVRKRWDELLTSFVKGKELALELFGDLKVIPAQPVGKVTARMWSQPLEPAPPTPLEGEEARPWRILQSVIRGTYVVDRETGLPPSEEERGDADDRWVPIRVIPSLMQGNTDTRYYWDLTHHIFRYSPTALEDRSGIGAFTGIHTVNEHYAISALPLNVRFYTSLIFALDSAGSL